jgi:hypothetical protein
MPDDIKKGVLKSDDIGQELFNEFVKERIVEAKTRIWSPMQKANLKT